MKEKRKRKWKRKKKNNNNEKNKKKRKKKKRKEEKKKKFERPNPDFRVHKSPRGPGASPFFFFVKKKFTYVSGQAWNFLFLF